MVDLTMDLGASSKVLGFSDPAHISNTALFSYHPTVYFYFMLAFLLLPYPLYRHVAHRNGWELATKSWARHWTDGMLACSYGLIVFVFGNYAHCFNWITVASFYPALFGYGLIAELPFTKTSLPRIRSWPFGMWVVFLIALIMILGFAGIHIYLASTLARPFVIYYVGGLLIPFGILMTAQILIKYVNNRNPLSQQDQSTKDQSGESHASRDVESNLSQMATTTPRLSLHIHHWQIFYVLAFFTRFDQPISQVAAGIVLACYMEGICAYGYDHLVNDD